MMISYKDIKITGHQRTGTHYIASLICVNFLNTTEYIHHYLNHKQPFVVRNPKIAYIYTYRDFDSVAKSIFVMRGRFGLQVDDYEKFLNTKYSEMWDRKGTISVNIKRLNGTILKETNISGYFRKIDYTPKEWWELYHRAWEEASEKNSNIIRVSYNDLLANFDDTMLEIAKKLGSNLKNFKNINGRVGWYV